MEDDPAYHSLQESHSLLLEEVEEEVKEDVREEVKEGCTSDEGGVNVSRSPLDTANSASSSNSLFNVRVWGDILFPFLTPSLIHERKVGFYKLIEKWLWEDP